MRVFYPGRYADAFNSRSKVESAPMSVSNRPRWAESNRSGRQECRKRLKTSTTNEARKLFTKKPLTPKAARSTRGHRKQEPNEYPQGWDPKRVEAVISHYENQTDAEAVAEDEAAYADPSVSMIAVPVELVEQVQKLIARGRVS